jgi:hypothetical protein
MNATYTSIKHAAPRRALVIGASRLGLGAANAMFAPVCTGF